MNTQSADSAHRNHSVRIPSLFDIFRGKVANGYRRIAQWRREGSLAKGKARQTRRRHAALFETLEPRLLLSADLIQTTAQGVALDATLRVADVDGAAMLQVLDNQSKGVLTERAFDQDIDVSVHGNDQSDKLVIGFDHAALAHQVRVVFDGGDGGDDEIVGPDRANAWKLATAGTGTLDDVSFTGVERVKGGAADDTFVVLDPETTTAVEGGAGNNTLIAANADNAWTVSGSNAGTLNGQTFSGIQNLTGGAGKDTFMVALDGQVSGTISGGRGSNTLIASDQDNAWTITGTDAGILNGQSFAEIQNITGGAGKDIFTFAP